MKESEISDWEEADEADEKERGVEQGGRKG